MVADGGQSRTTNTLKRNAHDNYEKDKFWDLGTAVGLHLRVASGFYFEARH
jgi:hypothetical protein